MAPHRRSALLRWVLIGATALVPATDTRASPGQAAPADNTSEAKRALRQGLDILLENGPADGGEAIEALQRAADLGDVSAKYHLAYLYWMHAWRRSPGWTDQTEALDAADKKTALALFLEVATTGDPYAAADAGTFFHEGIGGRKDLARARVWYEAAAKGGLANPAGRLAWMFEHGTGVRSNLVEAYKWLDIGSHLVSSRESEPAHMAQSRDRMARRMSARQVEEARSRARTWLASMPPFDGCYGRDPRLRFELVDDDRHDRDLTAWKADVGRQIMEQFRPPPCSSIESRAVISMLVYPDGRLAEHFGGDSPPTPSPFEGAFGAALRRITPHPLPPAGGRSIGVTLTIYVFFNETPLPRPAAH